MNIITNSDLEKFVKLLKAGIKDGSKKEMTVYTSAYLDKDVENEKEYFVKLDFHFRIDADKIYELFSNEDAGLTNQIEEMLK